VMLTGHPFSQLRSLIEQSINSDLFELLLVFSLRSTPTGGDHPIAPASHWHGIVGRRAGSKAKYLCDKRHASNLDEVEMSRACSFTLAMPLRVIRSCGGPSPRAPSLPLIRGAAVRPPPMRSFGLTPRNRPTSERTPHQPFLAHRWPS